FLISYWYGFLKLCHMSICYRIFLKSSKLFCLITMVASLQAQLPQINAADSVLISADAEMRQEGLEKFLWGKGFRNEWRSVNKTEHFNPASGLEIIYFHDYTYLSAELSDGRKIFLHPVFTD